MLLASDPYLYGPEGHFVVRPDYKDTFNVLFADFLLRLGLSEPDRRVALGQCFVLPDGQCDDRDRQGLLPGVRDDLRRSGEVGPGLGGGVHELDGDLVVHRLVRARRRGALDRAVRDLGHATDEGGIRECVDLDDRRITDRDAGNVRFVDLDLGLEHAHVGDRQQRGGVLVHRALDGRLTILDHEARHAARHGRVDRRLAQRALRVAQEGG